MDTVGVEDPVRVYPGQLSCPDVPLWMLSDDEVDWDLAALDRDEARLVARRVQLLGEARRRGLHQRRTRSLSMERWLRDAHRVSTREAGRRLRESLTLEARPSVLAALVAGEVSVEQAAVICRALDSVDLVDGVTPDDQEQAALFLLGLTETLDPSRLAVVGQQLVEKLTTRPSVDDPADEEAVERANRRAERARQSEEENTLHVRRLPDGSVTGRFRLAPATAAVFARWLDQADTRHPGEGDFADTRDPAVRRGDHLGATFAHACATGVGHTTPVDARVVVTVPLEALRRGLADAGVLDTGGVVSAAEARRLACTAGIVPAVLAGDSEVLDLGRSRRTFSPAQRVALAIRDGGCVGLGCDRPPRECEAHHQTEWQELGPTDLDNGALLCRFHHHLLHRQGWQVVQGANGRPALIPPASVDPQRRPRQHHRFRLVDVTRRRRT